MMPRKVFFQHPVLDQCFTEAFFLHRLQQIINTIIFKCIQHKLIIAGDENYRGAVPGITENIEGKPVAKLYVAKNKISIAVGRKVVDTLFNTAESGNDLYIIRNCLDGSD